MKALSAFLLAAGLVAASGASVEAAQSTGQLSQFAPSNTQPCAIFSLKDIAQADPILPGNPYFSVSRTTPGYPELIATLLTAAVGGQYLYVVTSGTVTCGFADVSYISVLFR